jgi:hypothetical protein
MELKNFLIGGAIGGVIAYFILKPKSKASADGTCPRCRNRDCSCQDFSKDPNAPQSQPYVVTYKGFSYPEKELFEVSPFKHFSGVGYKNLLGIDSSIVGGCC